MVEKNFFKNNFSYKLNLLEKENLIAQETRCITRWDGMQFIETCTTIETTKPKFNFLDHMGAYVGRYGDFGFAFGLISDTLCWGFSIWGDARKFVDFVLLCFWGYPWSPFY